MPHYEFFCHTCKKTFSKILTVAEHETGKIVEQTAVGLRHVALQVCARGRRARCTTSMWRGRRPQARAAAVSFPRNAGIQSRGVERFGGRHWRPTIAGCPRYAGMTMLLASRPSCPPRPRPCASEPPSSRKSVSCLLTPLLARSKSSNSTLRRPGRARF